MKMGYKKITAVVLAAVFGFGPATISASAYRDTFQTGSNIEKQNYVFWEHNAWNWAAPVESYLITTDDGFMKFQPVFDETLYEIKEGEIENDSTTKKYTAEYYGDDYHFVRSVDIDTELPLFGGFYAGKDGYYLITGQDNPKEDETVEVFRITKYDKNWNKVGSDSLYGANTTKPFDAGSCRVAEYGDYLVIRTSHEMYKYKDGNNHQSNVMIQFDKVNVKITDSLTDFSNNNFGYVSHSLNQFVKIDNNKIVSVDHGDAGPRSIALMQYPFNVTSGKFTPTVSQPVKLTNAVTFGESENYNITGTSVGGFEYSDSSYLIAESMVDMANYEQNDDNRETTTRNIYISTISKSDNSVTTRQITDYEEGVMTASTPHLVKIGDNRFVLMWSSRTFGEYEEYIKVNSGNIYVVPLHSQPTGEVFYVELDGEGNMTSDVKTYVGYLSDCAPIFKDDKIIWYVTEFCETTFDVIDLNQSEEIKLSKTTLTLEKGKSQTIKATVISNNLEKQSVTWSSSNNDIVTVSAGKVTAVGVGSAKVTATTANGKTAVCTVTVTNPTTSTTRTAIKTVTLKTTSYTYNGKEKKPGVIVKDAKGNTVAASGYTVKYTNNTKVGTAQVTVTGKGNYTDTVTKGFTIKARGIKNTKLSGVSTSYKYTAKTITPTVTVKDGTKKLVKGTDYSVSYKSNRAIGTATITVKGKGNYSGTITKTFKIVPKTVTLKSITSPKTKQLKVLWKADSTVTGYEILCSTNKNFKNSNKTKTVGKNKTTSAVISGVIKGKTYYVKVRAYKTVSGKKVYGSYSSVKTVKIK